MEVQQLHGFSSFIRRSPPQEVARWMRQMRGEVEHKQVGISSFDSPWVWSPPKKVYLVFLLLQVAKKKTGPKGAKPDPKLQRRPVVVLNRVWEMKPPPGFKPLSQMDPSEQLPAIHTLLVSMFSLYYVWSPSNPFMED